jgi:hypothetical protein
MQLYEALAVTEAEIAQLRERLTALEAERDALRSTAERLEGRAADEELGGSKGGHAPSQVERAAHRPGAQVDQPWERLTRTDAILRLLAEDGPLGPTPIAEQLRARGRP